MENPAGTSPIGSGGSAQSIRRILREWAEIKISPSTSWLAWPIDPDSPYEWHFTIRGPPESPFEKGLYHGRMVLPVNYPMAPPSIYFTTINGRFEIHKKVCLSASNYHPETWQPAWGIRSILEALHVFFKTPAEGAIHALDWPDSQRRRYAEVSPEFVCPVCQKSNAEIIAEAAAEQQASLPASSPSSFAAVSAIPHQPAGSGEAGMAASATPLAGTGLGDSCIPSPAAAVAAGSGGDSSIFGNSEEVSSTIPQQQNDLQPSNVTPPQTDEAARLDEIRRRRQPRTVASPSNSLLVSRMPHIVTFLGWLGYFLAKSVWESLKRSRVVNFNRRMQPRQAAAVIASLLVFGWALFTLGRYLLEVYQETFFLFDVPIEREWQQVTNPRAGPQLSVAERVITFRIHPWIRQLLDEIRLRRRDG